MNLAVRVDLFSFVCGGLPAHRDILADFELLIIEKQYRKLNSFILDFCFILAFRPSNIFVAVVKLPMYTLVYNIRYSFFFIYLLKFTICPIWTFGGIF